MKHTLNAAQAAATGQTAQELMNEDELSLALGRLDGILWLLIRCYGGEVKEEDRAGEYEMVLTLQYVHRLVSRMHLAFNNAGFGDAFSTALTDAYGLSSAIHAMTWSDGCIAGSDTVMVELVEALDSCVTAASQAYETHCKRRWAAQDATRTSTPNPARSQASSAQSRPQQLEPA
ncbi:MULTISPECIES: hypothetical protein [unclassified Polaromonas]|jgi:hypothetical protein|uniref:hypothetical protein n=1 Tax=unclassified Polaromonas TaxID=2638319 RepID=UPI000BD07F84|nr:MULTISPECIES: hypothetical protein [unclassified Polaromonas]OYZ79725.1 MAG: hypothetical protein B7Y09_09390 [Polaromonas sp. 24-63-21]OZA47305.1 MAG: hypothetical protein B7X88_22660 [Polaromonas sp. 17-63-33]HQS00765.1 hypothetical protein [Polaromonas sp.]HQS38946.1 hypothetical protein [Polaromonas sp.]HQT09800.1 hypothetical protein [Polaromonas sp.]